ncbi:uncharacterized protein I206_106822 [Kwoniella pini CBS 10737]|uniref:Uncharacterized protein n=1 Tax=Kwoniella pini CBS 10737 TaxID=1296096 RepID=A0A1B9I003_9TREE|nr:uncharacterized protein I206_05633 [Kwoniella pini CBS 10737]OCF48852.1 hypothetical protein I206_05633 [Kwoniella pini CBS 10737]
MSTAISPAALVWSLRHIRKLIIDFLPEKSLRTVLLLSSENFSDGVSKLYEVMEDDEARQTRYRSKNIARSHQYIRSIRHIQGRPPVGTCPFDINLFVDFPNLQTIGWVPNTLEIRRPITPAIPTKAILISGCHVVKLTSIEDNLHKNLSIVREGLPEEWDIEDRASFIQINGDSESGSSQDVNEFFAMWFEARGLFSISIDVMYLDFLMPTQQIVDALPKLVENRRPMPKSLFMTINNQKSTTLLTVILEELAPLLEGLTLRRLKANRKLHGLTANTLEEFFDRPLKISQESKLRWLAVPLDIEPEFETLQLDKRLLNITPSRITRPCYPRLEEFTLDLKVSKLNSSENRVSNIIRQLPTLSTLARAMVTIGGFWCFYRLKISSDVFSIAEDNLLGETLNTLLKKEIAELREAQNVEVGWRKLEKDERT